MKYVALKLDNTLAFFLYFYLKKKQREDRLDTEITVRQKRYFINLVEPSAYEDHDRLRPLYYKNSKVYIMCYGIDNRTSFINIYRKWIKELMEFPSWPIPIILVGMKNKQFITIFYVLITYRIFVNKFQQRKLI